MPEIELWCCGVRVRVPQKIIDEFNHEPILLIQLAHGDHVPPIAIEMLSKFWIAITRTQLILNRMKEAALNT